MEKDINANTGPFRVLLAEDDTVSREFLTEALRACGAAVTACCDGPSALAQAQVGGFELLLLDHHLPGLTGPAILAALNADTAPAARRAPAIAITAAATEDGPALLHAGFVEVLSKPMSIATLLAALRRQGCPAGMTLDDDAALNACGSPATMQRLRRILVDQEIPGVLAEIRGFAADPQGLRPTLHRLLASCGFCGTPGLAHATATLHHALMDDTDHDQVEQALAIFHDSLMATRTALQTSLATDV